MKNILISHDNLENGSAKSHLSLRASVHVISTGENTMIFTRPSRLHETASVMIYLPLKSTSPFPSVSNMSMTRCTRGFCWSSGRDMNSSTLSEPELSRSSFLNLFPNLLISSASTEMKQRERETSYLQTDREKERDRQNTRTKVLPDRRRRVSGPSLLTTESLVDTWLVNDTQQLNLMYLPSFLPACRNHFPVNWTRPTRFLAPTGHSCPERLVSLCTSRAEPCATGRTSWCRALSPNTGSCDTSFNTNHSADNHESARHSGGVLFS